MIMREQVSTLFGGWAEVRIPQPIEIGVEESSDMPSLWAYIRGYNCGHPSESLRHRLIEQKRTVEVSTEYTDIRIQILKAIIKQEYDESGYVHHVEAYEKIEPTVEKRLSSFGDGRYIASHWTALVFDTWERLGFVRFFEAWGKGTHAHIMSALAGTSGLKAPLSGMLGSNNGTLNKNNALVKRENGEWHLENRTMLYHYRYIRKLPPEGIENIRKHAYRLREQRRKRRG